LMDMPEQQPDPQVEFEKEKFADESARAWEKLDIERDAVFAEAIKDIAEAESKDEGEQLSQYLEELKGMREETLASVKLSQLREAHQQKMEQMQEQRIQQMESRDGNREGGIPGVAGQ